MGEYAVKVDSLTRKFGGFTAVDNLSFNIEKGSILAFIGPNGAGKTTTVRMLCGLLEPTSGDAIVGGYNVRSNPEKVKTRIGYMSQEFSLYEDLTVRENLEFFGGIYGLTREEVKERSRSTLEKMDLVGIEERLVSGLPRGWKQRLALSCAILHRPDIVFLDEPTSGVSPLTRRNFWEIIHGLSDAGITLMVTTHYMDEVVYASKVLLLDRGEMLAEGTEKKIAERCFSGRVFRIKCENIHRAMKLLECNKGVGNVSLFGDYLRVRVKEDGVIKEVREKLTDEGIQIYEIEKLEPSLEDIFIQMTGEEKSVESS